MFSGGIERDQWHEMGSQTLWWRKGNIQNLDQILVKKEL